MELTGKRIVMTGASGFIGRHVAQELLALGAEVYALVRAFSPHRTLLPVHERFHIVDGSLKDVRLCVEAAGQADGFLHFAWGGVNREEIDSPAVQAENVSDSLVPQLQLFVEGCELPSICGNQALIFCKEQSPL